MNDRAALIAILVIAMLYSAWFVLDDLLRW